MMQCVLSPAQVAEQAIIVQKVDQHAPPPPEEDVHAVEEAPHHHPPYTVQVSPSLPVGDVCDERVVTDEQGGIVMVSVFLLSHIVILRILRRFFPNLLLPSISNFGKPPPSTPSQDQYMPCPMTLLHIPQPSLPMVRVRTTSVRLLYTPRPCVSPSSGRAVQWSVEAVQCSRMSTSRVLVVWRKEWEKVGNVARE